MGLYDSIDNKLKNYLSKRDEVEKVEGIRAEMQAINETIREQLYLIGQFYWQKYYEGEYSPGEDLEFFETIDRCNAELKYLSKRVDECKVVGYVERESIDEATNSRIRHRMEQAEARRAKKAEERAKRFAEKECLRIETEERRRVEREEQEALATVRAAERAAEKERLANQRAAEKERLANQRAAEKERLANQRAAEKIKAKQARAAEKARVAAEKAEAAKAKAEALSLRDSDEQK